MSLSVSNHFHIISPYRLCSLDSCSETVYSIENIQSVETLTLLSYVLKPSYWALSLSEPNLYSVEDPFFFTLFVLFYSNTLS